jgi:hypothetical protein
MTGKEPIQVACSRIRRGHHCTLPACFVAAVGSTMIGSREQRPATAIRRAFAATTWVSALLPQSSEP